MPRDQIQVDEVEGLDVNAVGGAVQPPRIFSLQHRVELRGVVGCEANRRPVPAPSWQRRRCQRQRRRSRRGRARGFCVAEHAWKGGDVFDALGVQLAFARAGSSEVRYKLEGLATRVTRRLAACQRQPPSLVVGADATGGGPARALAAQRDNVWRRRRRWRRRRVEQSRNLRRRRLRSSRSRSRSRSLRSARRCLGTGGRCCPSRSHRRPPSRPTRPAGSARRRRSRRLRPSTFRRRRCRSLRSRRTRCRRRSPARRPPGSPRRASLRCRSATGSGSTACP
mmetsp:Transcript_5011/g.16037  ORF Transcript_5011/g.16037 Transcript_5011/m.16037 type:complete len:281 (-) Transcript_5011:659-1501(-)